MTTIECPECGGEGRREYITWKGWQADDEVCACDKCHGSGEIEVEEEAEDE